ncbi:MAG: hypothetical protein MOIL_01344 [Candidatus Methanolliviera sp. GoM_oil]|nr:MAG: hypothetical protein MOIL_01344 [Candidatus Methanolliviera sp. GoM_oil]
MECFNTCIESGFSEICGYFCSKTVAKGICNTWAACYNPLIEGIFGICAGGK